jgi:galactokinase
MILYVKFQKIESTGEYYMITVSTPSRICLFGEHQDYLGLEVIAAAINLRFYAKISRRDDNIVRIKIRDERINTLNQDNTEHLYEIKTIDLSKPITYDHNRDYLKSTVNLLLKKGYDLNGGFDIVMDSEIPIGKGMSSSSTMIIALIKSILEIIDSEDKNKPEKIAMLGFLAEVAEFNEPGGMMDHYTSSLGELVHLNFKNGETVVNNIDKKIPGSFILFDSMEVKNTTKVLADAKFPVLKALEELKPKGINSIRDFKDNPELISYGDELDPVLSKKLKASIDNFMILNEARQMLSNGGFDDEWFGDLIYRHHCNLRDGLGTSTPKIERILDVAISAGALGGKVNGSGGGGCCFVYTREGDGERILEAVKKEGYPGRILNQDNGVRRDR